MLFQIDFDICSLSKTFLHKQKNKKYLESAYCCPLWTIDWIMTRLLNVWPLTCSNKTTEVHTKNLPTKDQSLMETSKKISKAILRKNVTNANVCRIFRLTLYFSDFYLSTDVAWFVFVWQMDPFWWHFFLFIRHKFF